MTHLVFYFDLPTYINIYGHDALKYINSLMTAVTNLDKRGTWKHLMYTITLNVKIESAVSTVEKFFQVYTSKNTQRNVPMIVCGCVIHDSNMVSPRHGTMLSVFKEWSIEPSIYICADTESLETIKCSFRDYTDLIDGSFLHQNFASIIKPIGDLLFNTHNCVVIAIERDLEENISKYIANAQLSLIHHYADDRSILVVSDPCALIDSKLHNYPHHIAILHCRQIIYEPPAEGFITSKHVVDTDAIQDVKNLLELAINLGRHIVMSQIIAHDLLDDWNSLSYDSEVKYRYHCIYSTHLVPKNTRQILPTHTRTSNALDDIIINNDISELVESCNRIERQLDVVIENLSS